MTNNFYYDYLRISDILIISTQESSGKQSSIIHSSFLIFHLLRYVFPLQSRVALRCQKV